MFDLEFNQDIPTLQNFERQGKKYPFEIIQFGAYKLDSSFQTIGSFHRLVKPTFYSAISPFITELTGITNEQLQTGETFSDTFSSFINFIGTKDPLFCVWGMSDIRELFRNASYHKLETKLLPKSYIDIQPYVSLYLGFTHNELLRLQYSVEALGIPLTYPFHNALYDAYYTAELFKKVYRSSIEPQKYDPSYVVVNQRQRQVKRTINFVMLFQQFEKMYGREMTPEEQGMIKLAYQMGKTGQFLKLEDTVNNSSDNKNV